MYGKWNVTVEKEILHFDTSSKQADKLRPNAKFTNERTAKFIRSLHTFCLTNPWHTFCFGTAIDLNGVDDEKKIINIISS